MAKRPHVAACIVTLAMLLTAASTGLAQVTFPNAPCGTITINNTGLCTAQLRVVPVPAGWPNPIVVAAGAWVVLPGPPAGAALTINGIISLGGISYPSNPPPPSGREGPIRNNRAVIPA